MSPLSRSASTRFASPKPGKHASSRSRISRLVAGPLEPNLRHAGPILGLCRMQHIGGLLDPAQGKAPARASMLFAKPDEINQLPTARFSQLSRRPEAAPRGEIPPRRRSCGPPAAIRRAASAPVPQATISGSRLSSRPGSPPPSAACGSQNLDALRPAADVASRTRRRERAKARGSGCQMSAAGRRQSIRVSSLPIFAA